eukprot:GHUV01021533.1.p1 GENE.GHUV01021533.1~~GHUV01021533.1.p1  ORF type:complete len:408 (+),score=149.45 GHUV01021533.1:217-1440(+)
MTGSVEVLLTVPHAQLHKVQNSVQTLLVEGDFTVAIVGTGKELNEQRVEAAVAQVAWPLGKHLPALKAAATIYSFALEDTRDVYYILILPAGTPPDVLEAVYDVVFDSCALSTSKQVDAAYEEADKLTGGKEAAALEAAEAAGAPPEAAAAAAAAVAGPQSTLSPAEAAEAANIAAGKYVLPSSGNATADRVAAGLVLGGSMVASAVGRAAAATADAIHGYAQKQISNSKPNEKSATISPTFSKGLALAGSVASSAAYVTGKLASVVGGASYAVALAIAKTLPGHKKKKPGELVSPEERSALHTVGAAGLIAFVDVYDSLEAAAKKVLAQSGDASQQYISYKYGPEAGAAAAQSVPVAQDMLAGMAQLSQVWVGGLLTAQHSVTVWVVADGEGHELHVCTHVSELLK